MTKAVTFSTIAACLLTTALHAELDREAARGLLERVLPGHHAQFEIAELETGDGRDAYEIANGEGTIILRGTNGVAIGSALYRYLRDYTGSDISWNGTNLDLPDTLPPVTQTIRNDSPYDYRYYLNYTTYAYTMTWWDWERWEWEIDWMALHGINLPLALTGQDAVWQRVYRDMGFSDEELSRFFSGPAYACFNWLGLLDGWAGPLPQSWIDGQEELQHKILERKRSLGMKPVLPAFIGHVPPGFEEKFPDSQLQTIEWTAFDNATMLHPDDPMFVTIGQKFIEEQERTYGTDHYYSADAFIEVKPPTDDPEYLASLGDTLYRSMAQGDPDAVWVMQGWMFHYLEEFWQLPQVEAFLGAIPDDGVLILDLWTEMSPVWNKTEAYFGKPWVWSMVHNFGGKNNIFGRMQVLARDIAGTLHHPESGNMAGIGLTMEGIEQNPALYALFLENSWTDQPIDLDRWLDDYTLRRYGAENDKARHAWTVLRHTAYAHDHERPVSGPRSGLTVVPSLDDFDPRDVAEIYYYEPIDLLQAWELMIGASHEIDATEGFEFDIVDLTRQILADYSNHLIRLHTAAFEAGNAAAMEQYQGEILALIDDFDTLLATRREFLLGDWIEQARAWGTTEEEKDLYERNVRNILTLWHGPEDANLVDYSTRQWSGLLTTVYKDRWEHFFATVNGALEADGEFDTDAYKQEVRDMDWEWIGQTGAGFPATPQGDGVAASREVFSKYHSLIRERYLTAE